VKLVAGVLDKLGIERFTVIGHSLDGEVATALAEAHPARVKRIVLIDCPPKAETTFKVGTRLALTPVLGELLARLKSNAMVRKGLAQGFAPARRDSASFSIWSVLCSPIADPTCYRISD
jgi:pimeloyl-ACP methyl ester carboxylesterase